MLDLKYVSNNLEQVRASLELRHDQLSLDELPPLIDKRRELIMASEELKCRKNAVSKEISTCHDPAERQEKITEMKAVAERIKLLEHELKEGLLALENIMLYLPNIPDADVPPGHNERDNRLRHSWGTKPKFDFTPLNHWEIGENLGILDFKRAAKLAGARFSLGLGAGARMERALINFMLDIHTTRFGYREVLPPFMVNKETMTGTGQLPKFAEDIFCCEKAGYYLIPTAEVPVTNIHAGEILNEADLPIYYTAHTPCFRSEAGSYGKDTRGLIRQHQFNKVELVKITRPQNSEAELEALLANAEEILKLLELPYQVVTICSGDLGFSAAKTYDIEVWLPGQSCYREISSCSVFTDFQARRAQIRYRRKADNKVEYVHTVNGSGLAVGRTLVAILENYQQADGSVRIPTALVPYMNGLEVITKEKSKNSR